MRQDPAVTVKFRMKNAVETRQAVPVQDDDNAIEVVAGILKDEHGRYLMLYDNRVNSRMFPGGKIDAGELPVDALRRERQEELGVEVTSEQFVGHAKFVHQGKLFRLHYFSVEIVGTPVNQEPVKHGMMEWIETIPSENQYGFVLKFDQTVIADPEQMRLEFEDLLLLSDGRLFAQDVLHGDYAVYLLPWTTTPWTLPANMFAAVHRDIDYVLLYDRTDACGYILATACVEKYYKDTASYLVMQQMKGRELVGLWYSPLFSYYHQTSTIDQSYKDRVHTVLHADFVTTESGTGVVHEAPAFGADDYDLVCTVFPREKAQEWLFDPVNEYGEFTDLVSDFVGQNVFEANSAIIKELKQRGLLVKQETVNHSYPHCPRTGTPLIYKAIESRFVKEDDLKQQTVPAAEQMHFVPETVKKRFIEGLKSAPDRNISRTRYW